MTCSAKSRFCFLAFLLSSNCLCGAQAFVSQHPLGQRPSVVLNFESRGSSGPAVMFQTSAGNARAEEPAGIRRR